jgi:hypothetical protein
MSSQLVTGALVGVLALIVGWLVVRSLRGRHRRQDATGMSPDMGTGPESEASRTVRAWASGRACASCGAPLTETAGHHIALLDPRGLTREWVDLSVERLPAALESSVPVCWNCHIAAMFRREHPELVTDREDAAVRTRH